MTLRPMSYRAQGVEGAQPIMFDGAGGRTLFLETVNTWMVEHGFNPEVDLATQVATEFMTGITWEPVDSQHIVRACKSIATAMLESGDITEDLYKERFQRRHATIVVYDDPAFYVHES